MIGYTGIPLFEMMQHDPPHGWFVGFSLLLGFTSGNYALIIINQINHQLLSMNHPGFNS